MADHEKTLSVIIPSYNEGKTICDILCRVLEVKLPFGLKKEIVIVDDGSEDETVHSVKNFIRNNPGAPVKYVVHDINRGKGMAIRTGIKHITGEYVIIQDADLEYDPHDYSLLLPYLHSGEYSVVYGSRFLNRQNRHSYPAFYWGGRLVSVIASLLYGQVLTDEPTCYKMFRSSLLKSIPLDCTGFEFCPEITAKVLKKGYKIKEVAISYTPRSVEEGKKIKWTDGLEAIWVLLKYRIR
ncbi:glycosyltransferase family 2 protein [Coprobacter fastidiosus]|jgi:dolichol-phosphate mannosyltransferase|uniref:glycosyltransferase family 2 protein n=1 Tax=Coprobacter fastidiosus TaxID=1099853 RepID=UPI00241F3ACE|nr:glycosyltransferase family 2 protein [Coprobacter fastidiosus]